MHYITYGDLHGNFQKLLDHFIQVGVIEISDETYKDLIGRGPKQPIELLPKDCELVINHDPKLRDIKTMMENDNYSVTDMLVVGQYKSRIVQAALANKINELDIKNPTLKLKLMPRDIKNAIKNETLKIKSNDVQVILIGDVFADRCRHDKAKLELLTQLSQQNVQFKALWSNHDEMFLYQLVGTERHQGAPQNETDFEDNEQDKTLGEGKRSIRKQFAELVKKHYVLVDYDEETETLSSHAPMHLRGFNGLCEKLKLSKNGDMKSLCAQINEKFQDIMATAFTEDNLHNVKDLFSELVWTRKTNQYDNKKDKSDWVPNDQSLTDRKGIKFHYTGHDSYKPSEDYPNLISLDNTLGKGPVSLPVDKQQILILNKK